MGVPYDGYFHQHLKNNYGINRVYIQNLFKKFNLRIDNINDELPKLNSITEIRELIGYSQSKLAEKIGVSRGKIDYCENNGYTEEERNNIILRAKQSIYSILEDIKFRIQMIDDWLKFRWLKITNIETVPNEGIYKTDWVYDVTIEPTRNFISHGLILHNNVSIETAGIVATLQAKTAIIAAANPKLGRWNNYATAIENINLPPTILSRFDLIFVVHDTPERANDDRIAEYILKNHMDDNLEDEPEAGNTAQKKEDYIPMELLKKYIRHAKNISKPKLTKETAKKIRDFYVSLRNAGGDNTSGITIVARNLDGIVRMCEAYAKMAIRDIVTPQDVDIILDLVKQSQHDIGYDPETGTTDMDVLLTGTSSNKRNRLNAILKDRKSVV